MTGTVVTGTGTGSGTGVPFAPLSCLPILMTLLMEAANRFRTDLPSPTELSPAISTTRCCWYLFYFILLRRDSVGEGDMVVRVVDTRLREPWDREN